MGNMRVRTNDRAQFIRSKYRHDILKAARPIWQFLRKCEKPVKSDVIFVFGSDRLEVADKAAELYKKGFAGKIIFTGGTGGRFDLGTGISEAEQLKKRAIFRGIPAEDILVETGSTNTQQNILNGIEVLRKNKVPFSRLILVSLPYQSLRQWATVEQLRKNKPAVFEGVDVRCCPADYTLGHIRNKKVFKTELKRLVGEFDRIIRYREPQHKSGKAPSDPFIIWIDIPAYAWTAYYDLKKLIRDQY